MTDVVVETVEVVLDVVEVETEVDDELVDEVRVDVVTVLIVTVVNVLVIDWLILVVVPEIPLFDNMSANIRILTRLNQINRKDCSKRNVCN